MRPQPDWVQLCHSACGTAACAYLRLLIREMINVTEHLNSSGLRNHSPMSECLDACVHSHVSTSKQLVSQRGTGSLGNGYTVKQLHLCSIALSSSMLGLLHSHTCTPRRCRLPGSQRNSHSMHAMKSHSITQMHTGCKPR